MCAGWGWGLLPTFPRVGSPRFRRTAAGAACGPLGDPALQRGCGGSPAALSPTVATPTCRAQDQASGACGKEHRCPLAPGRRAALALTCFTSAGVAFPVTAVPTSVGPTPSRPTPLQRLLNNFEVFRWRAQGDGSRVTPFGLRRFCQLDWPTFATGWPSEGSLDLQTALQVRNITRGNHRLLLQQCRKV